MSALSIDFSVNEKDEASPTARADGDLLNAFIL
jgi:hypothetical protein